MSLKLPVALFETTITETISKTATTIPLASLSDGEAGTLTNGSVKGFILDEGEDSGNTDYGQEFIIGTIDTAGVRLTGCLRGVSFVDGITEKAANQKKHRRGASIKISSHPYLISILRALNGTDQFDATAMMAYNGVPALTPGSNQLATVGYADALAIAGAPDATEGTKGIVEIATQTETNEGDDTGSTSAPTVLTPSKHLQTMDKIVTDDFVYGEDITAGQALYLKSADSKWYKADASDTSTSFTTFGVALDSGSTGATSKRVQVGGVATGLTGLTVGYVYVSDTAGAFSASPGTYSKVVGYAFTTTAFLMWPNLDLSAITGATAVWTTDLLTEALTFFNSSNITGAEAETLTSAATNNADSLHGHAGSFVGMNDTFLLDMSTETVNYPVVSYSDATVKLITNGFNTTAPATYAKCLALAPDYGHAYYTKVLPVRTAVGNRGAMYIGSDLWTTDNNATAGNRVQKNGSNVTISGTTPGNNARGLAHDPTNSYLLLLDTTTTVQRYSGIAGTTITHVSTITLDTAVSVLGFLYDNTNSRYICLDLSGNLVRRFNASGTTVDTAAFTVDDTVAGIGGVLTIAGLVFIRDRVHIAYVSVTDAGTPALARIEYIPTTMTR